MHFPAYLCRSTSDHDNSGTIIQLTIYPATIPVQINNNYTQFIKTPNLPTLKDVHRNFIKLTSNVNLIQQYMTSDNQSTDIASRFPNQNQPRHPETPKSSHFCSCCLATIHHSQAVHQKPRKLCCSTCVA